MEAYRAVAKYREVKNVAVPDVINDDLSLQDRCREVGLWHT
jgi:hypothetical protein